MFPLYCLEQVKAVTVELSARLCSFREILLLAANVPEISLVRS